MIQDGKLRGFAMGHAIPVRTDYTAGEVRRLAQRAKDAAQARRLLAIAAVLDGASREEAAKIGGMDRQTLRDWVIRFNEQGPDGLINIPSPGVPPKLNAKHKAFLARIVEEGPISAIHGVVRWRACDLIMRLYEEFGLSVSDDTIYRALKKLGFSHMSARPKAYKQNAEAMDAFKKTSPSVWRKSAKLTPGTSVEVWFQDEMRVGQKNKLTYRWARKGSRPRAAHDQRTQSTYLFGAVCPERGAGAALVLPACNCEAMQLHLDEIATKVASGAHAIILLDQAGWHTAKALVVPSNVSLVPLPPRAPELNGQENIWQFMRQNWLSNRIFKSFDDIVDHCCYAWNTLIDQPWKIMSIARRDWAVAGHSI
jgi:transposase